MSSTPGSSPRYTVGAADTHAKIDAEEERSGRQSVQTKLTVPRAQN